MRTTTLIFILLLTVMLPLHAADWIVEAEGDGYATWTEDSIADIHAPKGLTLWYGEAMDGDCVIEYEARIVSDGRVSDLNCFWMASDPLAGDVFANLSKRGGRFLHSYSMQLYYVGYGGNHNSTTRFRRYDGDSRGIDSLQYRPAILQEYRDSAHLIKGDHWYSIRLEQCCGHIRYYIDNECLVDYLDTKPLTHGHFGFRTTLAHAQLRKFRWHRTGKDLSDNPATKQQND